MSNDCISRQDALDILGEYAVVAYDLEDGAYERARKAMCDLPSKQPEIIHCEECKYCRRENVTYVYADGTEQEVLDRYINCTKERYQPEVRLDDFCSRAERREDAVRKSDC